MKPKYIELKGIVNKHLNELNEIKNIKTLIPSKLIFSYKLQLRYMDEDTNYHLNYRSYFHHIEEVLISYHYNMQMEPKQYLNYSLTVVYWKEVSVNKYSHCFVNIYKKENIFVEENNNGNKHKGYDFYACLSVCKCCQRNYSVKETNDDHRHQWIHHTGFVARSFDKKPYKLTPNL